jgi:protein-L-isoaspartate O-methyltransferase
LSHPDTADTKALRAALAQQLWDNGHLRSPQWRTAIQETPRHHYVPVFYRQTRGAWQSVRSDDAGYFDTVYSDTALTTQLTDGRATSSSSQPSLMTDMLGALDIEDSNKVGEVATGTGYNAALICHRVGDKNVITMEVDSTLAQQARARLNEHGYAPVVLTGDARAGFPGNPTLDRLIITCGLDTFPYGLAHGMRPGGVIVCPLGRGNVRLQVQDGGILEGNFLAGGSCFMKARDEGTTGSITYPHHSEPAQAHTTATPHDRVNDEAFRFIQSLALGEFNDATEMDGNGTTTGYRIWTRDGSWAHAEGTKVRQAGPHRLWDGIEEAHSWFESHGHPSRHRFGTTITPYAQRYWLDEPDNLVPRLRTTE